MQDSLSKKLEKIAQLTDELKAELATLTPVEKKESYTVEQLYADATKVAIEFFPEGIPYPAYLLCASIKITGQNVSYGEGPQFDISLYEKGNGL